MNHCPATSPSTYLFKTALFSVLAITTIGCGSEPAEVVQTDKLRNEVEMAQQQAATAQAELNEARQQAKLLAQKIESIVAERNTLKQERDNLRSEVMKAGEKFASVQTQFSELRARSAAVNDAIESLDELISGTEPDESGIAIVPLNTEDGPRILPVKRKVAGPPEADDSTSVFARPATATDDSDE